MTDELHREHPPMENSPTGAQGAAPLGSHSSQCCPQHGIREGACGSRDIVHATRPERATRYIETAQGILSYCEIAPLLAENVQRLEEAVQCEAFHSRLLDEYLLCEFHDQICNNLTPDWAGKWRAIQVVVGSHKPPLPHLVPILMRNYALDLQARWEDAASDDTNLTLEFLAFAEGRFLSIHPFSDFNGRTIRVFLAELLRRLDLPLADLAPDREDKRTSYFTALEAADRQDWNPLIQVWKERFESFNQS